MTAFNITSLKLTSDTQFRTQMCDSQVEGLQDLIERNVKWKTPIQIASFDGINYLTDGFHRVKAYTLSGIFEIPEGQYEVLTCESMDEVIMLSMRANAAHGNKNTVADRVLMVTKLILMDEQRFMSNPFAIRIPEVMEALQITRNQARIVIEPKNEELKERRNAAIMELHKGGKSARQIAHALSLPCHKVVARVIEDTVGQKVDTTKCPTQLSPSVLPLANTEDRPDTRVDADEFVDDFLSEYDDYISLAEDETDSEPAPTFDLKAATGFGDDIANYTKRDKAEDAAPWADAPEVTATPVDLQDAWLALLEEEEAATAAYNAKMADIAARKAPVKQQADAKGISLPA